MTITTKYTIGGIVWHAEGCYRVPVRVTVHYIHICYDAYGNQVITYGFGSKDWHISEDRVFPSEKEAVDFVKIDS